MTRLLVSVRNIAEALMATDAGAHLIDVKEPDRGALGAADVETIAAVVAAVSQQVPTSAALGELLDLTSQPIDLPTGLRFAKIGLAGCGQGDDWQDRWRSVLDGLPSQTAGIAVAYADWSSANAPRPDQVLAIAQAAGCQGILLDTFDKQRGRLFDYLSPATLRSWIASTREAGLLAVVAGGLGLSDVATVVELAPDYLGVRGAACRGGRQGPIAPERVRQILHKLAQRTPPNAAPTSSTC